MFKVINKQQLAENVKRMDILAPNIAKKIQPGQFVSVCAEENYERIPITVNDADTRKGTITLIFQEVGHITKKLGSIPINDEIFSVLGPLGMPARLEKFGTVICAATGIGIAQILPICRALKEKGNKVIGVMGARTKRDLILEAQMRLVCDKFFITTDDGSYERRGMVTDVFKELLLKEKIDLVYTIGSTELMENISLLTVEKKIKTLIKVNPYMSDCVGMCGSCRVEVGGKAVLACIDGPEFDGHKINYKDLAIRMKAFEELDQWYNHKLISNQNKKESGTFTKFVADILRR